MFTQTFCDSPLDLSQKKWSSLMSFGLEATAVIALIAAPLFHAEAPAPAQTMAPIFTPILQTASVVAHSSNSQQTSAVPLSELHSNQLKFPRSIPKTIPIGDSVDLAPKVPWGSGSTKNSLSSIIGGSAISVIAPPAPVTPTHVTGGVMEGELIRKIQPVYPRLAIVTRTEGTVILRAIISREGAIEDLQVVSGSPYLSRAAVEAVRQWRYRPYRLNGVPVEVETQVTVNFILSAN